MKKISGILLFALPLTAPAQNNRTIASHHLFAIRQNNHIMHGEKGYSNVNGIKMYYEIYGQGMPLVLLHGGGSTIQTSFGRIIPLLAQHRQLICVELQAHGRTSDRNAMLSFEQDADDVAQLLKNLNIQKTDIFGFSNGGNTALQVAIRHPGVCKKIIAGSALLKRSGAPPQFWAFMKKGTFEQMPQPYKEAFLQVTPDSSRLLTLFEKCRERVLLLKDVSDAALRSIQAPVLLVNGAADVATPEHMDAVSKQIPLCRTITFPGGHGEYMGEILTLRPGHKPYESFARIIGQFLDEK